MPRIYATIAMLLLFFLPASAQAVKQVEFKKEIKEKFLGSPANVDVDEQGNIFIADSYHKTIFMLGSNGEIKNSWSDKARLKKPAGIAVYGDEVYVTDSGTDKVHVFTKDGEHVRSFGKRGGKPKEFKNPSGITIKGGIIYVADYGNKRVQTFSVDGVYMGSIGGKEVFRGPTDVTVDSRGYIIIADKDVVKIYTPQRKFQKNITSVKKPGAVEADTDGFFVADNAKYQIKKFDFKGDLISSFGTEGRSRAQFKGISGIAMDPDGNVVVADSKKGSIQVFSIQRGMKRIEAAPDPTSLRWLKEQPLRADRLLWSGGKDIYGTYKGKGSLFKIDSKGLKTPIVQPSGASWKGPGGMAIGPEGALWLAESSKHRIVKINEKGNVIFSIGSHGRKNGRMSRPSDIDISSKGIIYVADTGNNRIQTFNTNGVFLSIIGQSKVKNIIRKPIAVALDHNDNAYVLDGKDYRVVVFDKRGNYVSSFGGGGEGTGQFEKPTEIVVTGTEVFVLDSGNQRVQVFSLAGNYLREFGTKGKGRGDFLAPSGMTIVDDTVVVVSDIKAWKLQFFETIYTPRSPKLLVATQGMRQITLRWERNSEGFVDLYKIYRSEFGKTFAEIGTARDVEFQDTDILTDKSYYYRVSAVARAGNESGKSNISLAEATKYIPFELTGVTSTAGERNVSLSWAPSPEDFVTHYIVYKDNEGELEPVAKTAETNYEDRRVRPSYKYTYKIVAVSSDGIESNGVIVTVTTLKQTKPPVEIVLLEMNNVFSNAYKLYEKLQPVFKVRITNNTWEEINSLKVSLMIKEFMDFPTQKTFLNLKPWQSMDISLNAVFNNKVLDLTESTAVQAEIRVAFYEFKHERVFTANHTLNIYEKHYMTWDVRDRVATFVTPKDPAILEFAREIARQYSDENPDPIIYARALFSAMGVMGMTYIPDPNSPYEISARAGNVDYVQYPVETLQRKSGDCDDLVNLFSATLESLGVRTSLIDYPGHILMMFSTGINEDLVKSDAMRDMFVFRDGFAWVPVEMTLVGSPFMDAWREGIENYKLGLEKGLTIISLREAWKTFKPASLPATGWRSSSVSKASIEASFGDELVYLKNMRIRLLSKKYIDALYKDPSDMDALLQLGIIYGESGDSKGAEFFKKLLETEPTNAAALNNMGNVFFMMGEYEKAREMYNDAAVADPQDPMVWVNLARCNLRLRKGRVAKEAFDKATSLDPNVPVRFQSIAFRLQDPTLLLEMVVPKIEPVIEPAIEPAADPS